MNGLHLSPVVISYVILQGNRYLQVLCNHVAWNSCLGLFVLCEILFWFTYNTDKGGNSLPNILNALQKFA